MNSFWEVVFFFLSHDALFGHFKNLLVFCLHMMVSDVFMGFLCGLASLAVFMLPVVFLFSVCFILLFFICLFFF